MIKECNVILHNSAVTVIEYDGNKIQLPSVKDCGKYVYVEFKDRKYYVVSKEDYEKSSRTTIGKSKKVDEIVEKLERTIESDKQCD